MQASKHFLNIVRKVTTQVHFRFFNRVGKVYILAVQSLPFYQCGVAAVHCITQQGVTNIGAVHSYLVSSACQKIKFNKSIAV